MFYQFCFVHDGVRGQVNVFPAGANVVWNGMGFQIEAAGPALAYSIFKARLKLAQLRRFV